MGKRELYADRMEREEWEREDANAELLALIRGGDAAGLELDLPCNTCVVQTMYEIGRGPGSTKRREREMDMGKELVLLGLDPGGTTGWALLVIGRDAMLEPELKILDNIALYTYGEFTGDEHKQTDAVEEMLESWPGAAVVREDFILRTQNKDKSVLSPVRLGFGIDHLMYQRGREVFLQQPAMAKTTASDERLKSWGLYRPGSEHSRDATRHAITFARRAKDNRALLKAAWPHLFKKPRRTL